MGLRPPPQSAGGAGWWPARALGPVEQMPKAKFLKQRRIYFEDIRALAPPPKTSSGQGFETYFDIT